MSRILPDRCRLDLRGEDRRWRIDDASTAAHRSAVSQYRFELDIAAPPERVFALWTDLDRMREWVGGVTGVTDIHGGSGNTGTRYVVHFGPMRSPTEVLEAVPPRLIRTRFGSVVLRGQTRATFEPTDTGTHVTQEFWTEGLISNVMARIFASGSYQGSFEGELRAFATIAEREAAQDAATARSDGSETTAPGA
jgi:uncharacterized protein YndB with AHSA1/START domain